MDIKEYNLEVNLSSFAIQLPSEAEMTEYFTDVQKIKNDAVRQKYLSLFEYDARMRGGIEHGSQPGYLTDSFVKIMNKRRAEIRSCLEKELKGETL